MFGAFYYPLFEGGELNAEDIGSVNHKSRPLAVVVPAGQWQERLIRCLQLRGYHVLGINPFATEATDLADEWLEADIFDFARIVESLERREPALVVSDQCEIAMEPVAELRRRFGLPEVANDVIARFRNKNLIATRANELGIPTLESRKATTREEVDRAIGDLGYPLVIKPTDSNSSQGVTFLHGPNDEWDFSSITSISRTRELVVQRYFSGRQFCADGIVVNGRNRLLCIGEQFAETPGIINRVEYPANISRATWETIGSFVDLYCGESGLENAISHAEFLVNGRDIRLLEIAMRGGGSATSSHIVPAVSGVDPYSYYPSGSDRSIAPDLVHALPYGEWKCYITNQFLSFGCGRVKRIENHLHEAPGLLLHKLWIKPGEIIQPAIDCKTRHGLIMISGKDQSQVNQRIEIARSRIRVELE